MMSNFEIRHVTSEDTIPKTDLTVLKWRRPLINDRIFKGYFEFVSAGYTRSIQNIAVGREGEELAFISWQDPSPLPLKFFSFGTWPGVEAKWLFDCPRENNVTVDSKEVEKEFTNLERLRNDLLTFYDPYVRPVLEPFHLTVVTMQLVINYVTLDEYKSALEVKGLARLTWKDEKMQWDPADYGDIRSLHIVGRQIWQPDLTLYHAVDSMGRDILDQSMMVVTKDGSVQWTPSIHMRLWCDASELGHWPSDTHSCVVLLGFWANVVDVQLQFNHTGSTILQEQFNTEWNLLHVFAMSNFDWNNTPTVGYSNKSDAPFLKLIFELKRNSNVYGAVFFAPFWVVAVAMLSTFWVSPFGYLKISLGCLQLIIITLVLVNLASFIPVHPNKVPYLIILYNSSYLASLACILISIMVINMSRSQYKTPVPHYLWKILISCPVNTLLLLPKVKISNKYGKLDDAALAKHDETIQSTWILLGNAIDRIAFIIYFVLIIVAICHKY